MRLQERIDELEGDDPDYFDADELGLDTEEED